MTQATAGTFSHLTSTPATSTSNHTPPRTPRTPVRAQLKNKLSLPIDNIQSFKILNNNLHAERGNIVIIDEFVGIFVQPKCMHIVSILIFNTICLILF